MRILITALLGFSMVTFAQDPPLSKEKKFPLTVSIYSEAVSIPDFRNIVEDPHIGVRVGTEFYYSSHRRRKVLQTFNVGYYHHRDFQNGYYASSEFGYRRFISHSFVDVTAGLGYLLIDSAFPRYKKEGNEFYPVGDTFGRIMPTIGLGVGHQFNRFSVFGRYELFGEMPFGYRDVPALPHQSLHLGTRFYIK